MLWPKVVILIVLFASCAWFGKWWATNDEINAESQVGGTEVRAVEEAVMGQIAAVPLPVEVKAGEKEINHAWSTMKKIPKNARLIKLSKIFGSDAVGTNLYHTLLANSLEGTVEGSKEIREDGYKKARKDSKATMQKIKEAISALDVNADSEDKLRLLDVAANLEGVSDDVQELGLNIMQNNILPPRADPNKALNEAELNKSLSTNIDMLVPVAGLALALGTTSDPNQALNFTVDGIKVQADKFIQQQMADGLVQKFPQMAEPLQAELKMANINVNVLPEAERAPSSEDEAPAAPVNDGETAFLIDKLPTEAQE